MAESVLANRGPSKSADPHQTMLLSGGKINRDKRKVIKIHVHNQLETQNESQSRAGRVEKLGG